MKNSSKQLGNIRVKLIQNLNDILFQHEHGDGESQAYVQKQMPSKVKKRRKIQTEDGVRKNICYKYKAN